MFEYHCICIGANKRTKHKCSKSLLSSVEVVGRKNVNLINSEYKNKKNQQQIMKKTESFNQINKNSIVFNLKTKTGFSFFLHILACGLVIASSFLLMLLITVLVVAR